MRKKWKLLVEFIKLHREDNIASFSIETTNDTIIITCRYLNDVLIEDKTQLRLKYK